MVLGLAVAFGAQAAYAEDLSLGKTCLRCDPAEIAAAAASAPKVETSGEAALPTDYTRVTADDVSGQTNVKVRAEGNVIIERNEQVLNAQWVDYNQQTETVTAGDQFTLYDNGSVITGEKFEYKLADSTGTAENLQMETEHEGRRLQAVSEQAELQGKNRYRLQNTQFNTCQRGDASWYVEADSIEADYETGIGVAKGAGTKGGYAAKAGGLDIGLYVQDDPSSSTGKKLVIVKGTDTSNTITVNNFNLADAQDLNKG